MGFDGKGIVELHWPTSPEMEVLWAMLKRIRNHHSVVSRAKIWRASIVYTVTIWETLGLVLESDDDNWEFERWKLVGISILIQPSRVESRVSRLL
jgi:hypothetical protein